MTNTKTRLVIDPIPPEGIDLDAELREFDRHMIREALTRTSWNKTRAASMLGLNRTTLITRAKKYGLTPPPAYSTKGE